MIGGNAGDGENGADGDNGVSGAYGLGGAGNWYCILVSSEK